MATDYGTILRDIGYKLNDRGNYWQTAALFRDGDNNTAISIYKDTGVWIDFVESGKHLPFEALLQKTLKVNDVSGYLTGLSRVSHVTRELLKEERTFPESSLRKLLPDYDYFCSRKISRTTQEFYKCGLATQGKMYQRITFPIYRLDGKIHGFIGRQVVYNEKYPKWSNFGKTAEWFYPFFSVEGVREQIQAEQRVFLIESIGDSMALCQNDIKNNLVCFTNKVSSKMLSKLSGLGVDIVLSLGNDEGQNRGFDGALTILLKLMDIVDLNKIWFCPPTAGDFGDMEERGEISEWKKGLVFDAQSNKEGIKRLLDYAPKAKIAKGLIPKVKKLRKEWELL